jgi:hypothetical protein
LESELLRYSYPCNLGFCNQYGGDVEVPSLVSMNWEGKYSACPKKLGVNNTGHYNKIGWS